MTDNELYQIVKEHREAWPEVFDTLARTSGGVFFVRNDEPPIGRVYVDDDEQVADDVMMLFEASFHRKLVATNENVLVTKATTEWYYVKISNKVFEAASLIEAYAKALEWLK